MASNPLTDLLSYDLNSIDPRKSRELIFKYLYHVLYSKEYKMFKGIPREYTDKYIFDFNKILKMNNNSVTEILIPLYEGDKTNFTCYFVFADGMGHAYGSFKKAYLYAAKVYLDSVILYEDDIIKDLADNIDVYFGQVLVQDNKMIYKDLISVVDKHFYVV